MTGTVDGMEAMRTLATDIDHRPQTFMCMLQVFVIVAAPSSFFGDLKCLCHKYSHIICGIPHFNNFDLAMQSTGRCLRESQTIMMDYSFLASIYRDRDLRSYNWGIFRRWIKTLPHSELIIGGNDEKDILGDSDV